ncbi:MAG: hypothetical protein Fur0035_18300 [Anaerolineales bacterium]
MPRFRAFHALLIFSVLLAACSPQVIFLPLKTATPTPAAATPTATPAPSATPVPGAELGVSPSALRGVEIAFWHGADGSQAALLAQLAAEFSLSNAWGISVKPSGWGNYYQLGEAVRAAKTSSSQPDLLLALPEQAAAWEGQSLLAPLAPYLQHPEFGFSPAEQADFAPPLAKNALTLPTVRSARLLAYNLTWARELGFQTAPQTPAQFRQQVCAANAAWRADADPTNDGYGGWVVDENPWTAYAWLRAFGADPWNGADFAFNTPAAQQTLSFLQQLRADGCAWVSDEAANYAALPERKALFATLNLAEVPEQAAAFLGKPDQWTLTAFPGQAGAGYGAHLALAQSSPARQLAAWLFARWLLTPEIQARWAAQTGYLPARLSALNLMGEYTAAHPQWAAAAALNDELGAPPFAANWGRARDLLGSGLGAVVIVGGDPLLVLPEIQKTFDSIKK